MNENEDDDWHPSDCRLIKVEVKADDSSLMQRMENEENLPELYDPVKDLKYEKWAKEKFGKVEAALSCPKCFTGICFEWKSEKNNYTARKTFNTLVGDEVHSAEQEKFLSVKCAHCKCTLGVLDPASHLFYLFHVLEGFS